MRKKKLRVSVIFTVLFLTFLLIMDYPFLARLYNRSRQGGVVTAYEAGLTEVPDQGKQRMMEEARAYNERLASGTGMDLKADFEKEEKGEEDLSHDREYERLLNAGEDGVMGRVEIPKLGVDLLIYHGTSEEVLQKGAGHLKGSSLPVGGVDSNICISAHRGLVGQKMFTNLDELKEGDLFFLHVLDETFCYRVGEIRTILPEDTEELVIRRGEELATLITCTPYGINTHRLCVEGSRIPYTEEAEKEAQVQAEEKAPDRFWQDWGWLFVSAALICIMCVMLIRYNRKKQSAGTAQQ